MATRTISHFKVGAGLFNDIVALLGELPAKASRDLLNRIENAAECEPLFKVEIKAPKKKRGRKRSKKVARKPRRT